MSEEANDPKSDLEKLQEELDAEAALWNERHYHLNNLSHSNESIFQAKAQLQAITNVLIKLGLATEDQLNLEFKTVLLNDLRGVRENVIEPAESAATREHIMKGVLDDPRLKKPWEK